MKQFLEYIFKTTSVTLIWTSTLPTVKQNLLKHNNLNDFTTIFEAAKIICNQILKHQNWKFDDSFSQFDLPVLLLSLLKWIISGRKHIADKILKKNSSDNHIENIAQINVKTSRSDRQVKHMKHSNTNFSEVVETLFLVELGIHVHKETQ